MNSTATQSGSETEIVVTADKPSIGTQVKQQAKSVLSRTQEKAGGAIDQATTQVKSRLNESKDTAAESLSSVAVAVRDAGDQLRHHEQNQLSGFTNDIARTVENVSDYLKRTDVDEVVQQTETFARRNVGLFLGGALALGFLAGRFLASSSSRNSGGTQGNATATPALPEHATPYASTESAFPESSTTFADLNSASTAPTDRPYDPTGGTTFEPSASINTPDDLGEGTNRDATGA